MLYVVCCLFWLYFHRYLLRNQRKLDNVVLHTDPKSTTLGPQLIFISKKPPFEPRPVSVFKAGENACKDCFWSFFFKTFIKILFQTANDNESTAINGNANRKSAFLLEINSNGQWNVLIDSWVRCKLYWTEIFTRTCVKLWLASSW